MCIQTQDESKCIFAMKELLIEIKCIMYSCERCFWLPVHLPERDRAGEGRGTGLEVWVCFLLFPKLNSMKHWGADGFAVITQIKRKEITSSNRESLTKCSFRDQGKGGWGGGGQLQPPPSPCSTAVLDPCRRTHSLSVPAPRVPGNTILHKPGTAPGSQGNLVGACLTMVKNWFAGRWSHLFFGIT